LKQRRRCSNFDRDYDINPQCRTFDTTDDTNSSRNQEFSPGNYALNWEQDSPSNQQFDALYTLEKAPIGIGSFGKVFKASKGAKSYAIKTLSSSQFLE
jgi:hypothetical protein